MKRKVIAVVAAVALAVVGTAALVAYVGAAEDRALAGESVVDVLVVSETIERGTPAADLDGFVTTERVPAKVRADDAVSDLEDLGNRVAAVDLLAGEQLVAGRFVAQTELAALGEVEVPDGLLQVTVAVAAERAVGARIEAGATVGIVSSFAEGGGFPDMTHFIKHKALVTAVQGDVVASDDEDPNQAPTENLLVTLALTAPEVERLVFTAEFGSIWLAFEPPDAPEGGTSVITKAEVFS